MDVALQLESQRLAEELYALIRELDPAIFKAELAQAARDRMERVRERARVVLASMEERGADLRDTRFAEAVRTLAELRVPRPSMPALPPMPRPSFPHVDWKAQFKALQPQYTAIATRLRQHRVELPEIRGTNRWRAVFHALNGLLAFACVEHVMSHTGLVITAVSFFTLAWSLETTRRIWPRWNEILYRSLERVAHPHERHAVNSATWFATALLPMAILLPSMAGSIGLVVLALADPSAAAVGRRWGRIRLRKNRSLEGTMTFAITGFALALAVQHFWYPAVPMGSALLIAVVAGLSGAIAELASVRVDDNFSIPVATGFMTWAAMALLL